MTTSTHAVSVTFPCGAVVEMYGVLTVSNMHNIDFTLEQQALDEHRRTCQVCKL
jgi:hypothetical protein